MTSQEEQEQRRQQPAEHDGQDRPGDDGGAVRYGDVFAVEGELARTPVAPQDAAMMQAPENAVLGQAPKGGPLPSCSPRPGATSASASCPATRPPGGLAAQARAAADANAQAEREADKTTLRQVVTDATVSLGADKEVDWEDAAHVVSAEVRSDPNATARPGGVGASIAAAARLNRGRQ